MHVIVFGNPIDGIQIVGPFPCGESANLYAESYKNTEWWIADLEETEENLYNDVVDKVS